ncbi:hypothetical protein BJY00DRAFT_294475 [Aspergillus carlsbadensis]|nr:hypothetical protein BJY00DRAFT_294475 [Aspergillus carlsbadensis]
MKLLVCVALALWAPRLTTAQICTPEDGRGTYNITGASQARSLFSDCDTILADQVSIDNWDDAVDGTFSLSGITNITGTLICNYDAARTNISSLEMPDLQHLGGLQTNARPFDSIWFDELQSVSGRIDIVAPGGEPGAAADVTFPRMKDAGAVSIEAGWTLINFESLETVQGDLILIGAPAAPLPALRSAGYIRIQGEPSFIHLPNLQTAGPPRGPASLSTGSGIDINQENSGMSLVIPVLAHVVGGLSIRGTIIGCVFLSFFLFWDRVKLLRPRVVSHPFPFPLASSSPDAGDKWIAACVVYVSLGAEHLHTQPNSSIPFHPSPLPAAERSVHTLNTG